MISHVFKIQKGETAIDNDRHKDSRAASQHQRWRCHHPRSSKERIIYDAVWSQYPRMVDPSRISDCNAEGHRVTAPKCCFCQPEHSEHFCTQNWNLVRASWLLNPECGLHIIFMFLPFVQAVIPTTTFWTIQMRWYLHWCSFFKSFMKVLSHTNQPWASPPPRFWAEFLRLGGLQQGWQKSKKNHQITILHQF